MDEHVIPSKVRSERSPAYIINSVIALIIMIGFKYVVPASDPLTPLGVEILGILLGTLYGLAEHCVPDSAGAKWIYDSAGGFCRRLRE